MFHGSGVGSFALAAGASPVLYMPPKRKKTIRSTRELAYGLYDAPLVFAVSEDDIIAFINGCGSYEITVFEALDSVSADSLLFSFGTLLVENSSEVAAIRPERDPEKRAIYGSPLPFLPFNFDATRESYLFLIVCCIIPRL